MQGWGSTGCLAWCLCRLCRAGEVGVLWAACPARGTGASKRDKQGHICSWPVGVEDGAPSSAAWALTAMSPCAMPDGSYPKH